VVVGGDGDGGGGAKQTHQTSSYPATVHPSVRPYLLLRCERGSGRAEGGENVKGDISLPTTYGETERRRDHDTHARARTRVLVLVRVV